MVEFEAANLALKSFQIKRSSRKEIHPGVTDNNWFKYLSQAKRSDRASH